MGRPDSGRLLIWAALRAAGDGHVLAEVARHYGGVVASNLRVVDAERAPFAHAPAARELRARIASVA